VRKAAARETSVVQQAPNSKHNHFGADKSVERIKLFGRVRPMEIATKNPDEQLNITPYRMLLRRAPYGSLS
jgi:hypothetical protein